MASSEDSRPNPDALLDAIKREEEKQAKARLKIFFGMCAGVGKTYDMLKAAHEAQVNGIDVIVGIVETHGRPETAGLLEDLKVLPRKRFEHRGTILEEMDLDGILARKPKLVLVDELAHTNAPGSRHRKRYQDVLELIDNGIDVYTTLNVQHLESRADTVAQITGATVRETVPDSIMDKADEVEVIDISPEDLLKRLSEGKVYTTDRSRAAVENFFRKGNLTALREMSLRVTAERVDHELRDYMQTSRISGPWKSGQRLIVGISGSPHSAPLIRWARRMAYILDATWVATYVETSRVLPDADREELGKNIKLARELGAEIITTSDEDVARALIRVARQENCTQILVGRSGGHIFRKSQSLLHRLIENSGGLDVYVVGGEKESQSARRTFFLPRIHSQLWQYGAAAGIVLLVALLCFPFSQFIGYRTVALILLFTVAFLPLLMGIGPVLLAAALSALLWDYMFIPPVFTFSVAHVEDVLMLVTYFCIAIVSGVLTARTRAQERAVRQREERAVALYTLTRDLSTARSRDDVVQSAVSNVRRFFNADVVVCLGQTDGDIFTAPHPASSLAIDEKELGVAAWVYWNEKKAGKHTDTLPSAVATYFPLSGPRYPLGVIGVRLPGDARLSIDQEGLLENFIGQISSAIERETLNEITKNAIVIEQSERLYKTLFDSVSHEMRTPLASIMGASESLLDEQVSRREEVRTELVHQIHEAAGRMDRLVGNLLDMTRLESGLIHPKLDWCDVGDLINGTVRKAGKELSQHPVTTEIPDDLPLLRVDFTLIEQALTNLLVNAATYTPPGAGILVSARKEGDGCLIAVSDSGPGLPPEDLKRIFDKFYRVPGTRAGGTGLGLSIARGFIETHGGSIKAEQRTEGGLRFTIALPVESQPSGAADA